MLKCECDLVGVSDLMFGAYHSEPRLDDNEKMDDYDRRTWRFKVHQTAEGQVFLGPFALKNAMESAGKWLAMKIKGEGSKTYTKRLASGLLTELMLLEKPDGSPLMIDDVEPVELLVPSQGVRGQGSRVPRIFPRVEGWRTHAVMTVFDSKLTAKVLEKHFISCGQFIGFGSMRVENGGINGRFEVHNFSCKPIEA